MLLVAQTWKEIYKINLKCIICLEVALPLVQRNEEEEEEDEEDKEEEEEEAVFILEKGNSENFKVDEMSSKHEHLNIGLEVPRKHQRSSAEAEYQDSRGSPSNKTDENHHEDESETLRLEELNNSNYGRFCILLDSMNI